MSDPYEFEMDPDDFVDDSTLPEEDDVNVNMVKILIGFGKFDAIRGFFLKIPLF